MMTLPEFGKPLAAEDKRLILGKPTQQLFPLKYEFVWQYYRDAQANHWMPEDIALGKDRQQYLLGLSEDERRMFDFCLAMLTTQDLVVMGNLEEGIESHMTAPEVSMYLARQTDEESIHTLSYQWIVESLALDPKIVYEKYLHEPTLYNKVKYAYYWHDRIASLTPHECSVNAYVSELLECLAFWTLGMEGGWFYNGFNWAYALRRRGLMQGTAEIFKYIQRDETMHFNFWIDVMNEIIREYPEAYNKRVQENIVLMSQSVVDLEDAFAHETCRNVFGITAKEYMGHFRHFMNTNLDKLGLPTVFKDAVPMGWLAEMTETNQETNFFEGRVREYRKGGLAWGDEDSQSGFESVLED